MRNKTMKPILVHVHVYYPELWQELKGYLKNIPQPYVLYFTTISRNKFLKKEVLSFQKQAHFKIVENRGYDVAPFLSVLNEVNLDDFSYIIKIHSKRDMVMGAYMNTYSVEGALWRHYSLNFLKKENLNLILSAFQKDFALGMVADFHLILNSFFEEKQIRQSCQQLFKKLSLKQKKSQYVAGTMFICRASLFKKLKELNLKTSDFTMAGEIHRTSLAHALERFFGYLITAQGYKIQDVFTQNHIQRKAHLLRPFRILAHFIYRKKVNKQGQVRLKICKIPIPYIKK